jgi:hypothetical protein
MRFLLAQIRIFKISSTKIYLKVVFVSFINIVVNTVSDIAKKF